MDTTAPAPKSSPFAHLGKADHTHDADKTTETAKTPAGQSTSGAAEIDPVSRIANEPDTAADDAAAKEAAGIQAILAETNSGPAPVRTSIDSGSIPQEAAVIAAVDKAPDADTVMVHPAGGLAEFLERDGQPEPTAGEPESDEPEMVEFTCSPYGNLTLGPYSFVDGKLSLEASKVDEFAKLVDQQPRDIKSKIQRIGSLDEANEIARRFAANRGKQTSGTTTTDSLLKA